MKLTEADTRAQLIDPALAAAGWPHSNVRREVICPGRILESGKRARALACDYVLYHQGRILGALEAKAADKALTEGLAQAKDYAARLGARFAFCSNGRGFYQVDMRTGAEGEIAAFPAPQDLWARAQADHTAWQERFAAVPFEDKGGTWQPRYYQRQAIRAVLDAVAGGERRILLTLATGAGKTAIAFQVAWALFQARWNLSGEPTRRPRILFLADRNTLADQALSAFSSFAEDALERITPEEIRKKGAVPKNAAVFFAIYQTFMTGENDPCFHDYPPDFFDFVIVDECHRGGARDESTWRAILEHFAPAVQLGMTATPKREGNADTYAYFGEPVYRYSLKEGVNDGFLVPFKVHQMSTTIDDYVYTPDDEVLEGEVEERRRYTEADFNRIIEIREREAYRVGLFMAMLPPGEKAVVFCATQEHAAAVRDLVNQYKVVHKVSDDPLYCVRITADEGKVGDNYLEAMKENDKSSPLIATTSEKLSTGVDIENLRHIVLMRPIKSMIAFKQIIGRGTRTCDSENKTHFTLYDFVKAYEHFNDPEWDGEPLEPPGAPPEPKESTQPPISPKEDGAEKIRVRLADGKVRLLQNMVSTTFWDESGRPMMASAFIEKLFGDMVPALFKDEAHLRTLWADPDTRKQLLCALHEKGCGDAEIQKLACLIQAQDCDIFDILAYISFALDPVSRQNRADTCERKTLPIYDANIQSFLCFVLRRYIEDGTADLDPDHLPGLLELYCGPMDHVRSCVGDLKLIKMAFRGFQRGLYGTHNSH